jgi:hypothetical protein
LPVFALFAFAVHFYRRELRINVKLIGGSLARGYRGAERDGVFHGDDVEIAATGA